MHPSHGTQRGQGCRFVADSIEIKLRHLSIGIQLEYSWILSHKVEEQNDRGGTAGKITVPNDDGKAMQPKEKGQG
jgi:hypothetical protein